MVNADDMIYFKNYHKGLAAPFVIYADFEAITEKVYGCKPNNDKLYGGENAVYKFMEKMLEEVEWCKQNEI